MCCGEKPIRRGKGGEEQADMVWVACLPPGAMEMSRPELMLRAMSGFMSLLQPGSVLMWLLLLPNAVPVPGVWADTWDHVYVWVMLPPGSSRSERPAVLPRTVVTSSLDCCQRAMSGSVVLLHLGSVLMFVAPAIIKGCADVLGVGLHTSPYSYPGSCCCCSHDNLSGLHCQLGHADVWTQVASEGHSWVHHPSAAEVRVNVYCLCTAGAIWITCVEVWGPCWASSAFHWPWES